MKATISNTLAVKAAADLANGGYSLSVFQVRRVGDKALVSGTNGYVSISVSVDATFNRWPDGKCLTYGKSSVLAMMRGIGKCVKAAANVNFERTGDHVSVEASVDGACIRSDFDVSDDNMARMKSLDEYDWENPRPYDEGESANEAPFNPHFVKLACQAVRTLSLEREVNIEIQKSRTPMRFKYADDAMNVTALVMPIRVAV